MAESAWATPPVPDTHSDRKALSRNLADRINEKHARMNAGDSIAEQDEWKTEAAKLAGALRSVDGDEHAAMIEDYARRLDADDIAAAVETARLSVIRNHQTAVSQNLAGMLAAEQQVWEDEHIAAREEKADAEGRRQAELEARLADLEAKLEAR